VIDPTLIPTAMRAPLPANVRVLPRRMRGVASWRRRASTRC